jgi:hypothetical protein
MYVKSVICKRFPGHSAKRGRKYMLLVNIPCPLPSRTVRNGAVLTIPGLLKRRGYVLFVG